MQTVIVTTPEALRPIIQEMVAECLKKSPQAQASLEQSDQPDKILTRNEVKEKFGVSFVTLNNWTKKGILTASKFGGRVYYEEGEIKRLLKERRRII